MSEPYQVWKFCRLETLFDQEICEIDRVGASHEAEYGIEFTLQGEQDENGKQLVPARKLQILPVMEDGKPRLRFEVTDL